ncbi:MAG: hypothetical protein JXA78_01115 [Anaerolineales bacterium]|nr:hypothetical protein [Anaerolineales bacterium]
MEMKPADPSTSLSPLSRPTALAIWRAYWLAAILQGVSALVFLLQTQSEAKSAFLLGLSPTRIAIALSMLAALAAFTWLLVQTWIYPQSFDQRIAWLRSLMARQMAWGLVLLLAGLLFLGGLFLVTLTPEIDEPFTRAYFDRMLPLAAWGAGLGAQTLIALLLLRYGPAVVELRPPGKPFYLALIIAGAILLAWFWIARPVIPQETMIVGWNSLGVPLLEFQLLLAWIAGMIMLALTSLAANKAERVDWLKKLKPRRMDLLIGFLIWLSSVILWQSIPISTSWFVSEPFPPNYEYYPTSDARAYDASAQTALIGEGFRFQHTPYVRRSFLALYLTILHLIGGQDYERVVFLQIMALAFFPVLIYLLTKTIHNRVSAVIAAILVMLREANSIAVAGVITASHAKLLMADLPTALAVVGLAYFASLWLKNIETRKLYALVTGGILGIGMLIRLETLVLSLPLAAISGLILLPKKVYSAWVKNMLLFALGVILVISPWVWRNYDVTGQIFIDSPVFRFGLIYQRFRPIPTQEPDVSLLPEQQPQGSPATQAPQSTVTATPPAPTATPIVKPTSSTTRPAVKYAKEKAPAFILKQPGLVAHFIVAHYLNSQLQIVLSLPTTFRALDSLVSYIGHRSTDILWSECCSLQNYVRRMPFWHKWDGGFPSQAIVPLMVNLLLFAAGIHESWKRQKLTGLAPLSLATTYMLFNALFRNSGGRYVLPIDWSGIFYYSIGLAQLSIIFVDYISNHKIVESFGEAPSQAPPQDENLLRSVKFYVIALALLALGCAAPVMERSFPRIYTPERQEQMLTDLVQSELISEPQRLELQTWLSHGAYALAGRALYPRYFAPNVGDPVRRGDDALSAQPYPRLSFYLAGRYSENLAMPVAAPLEFPNARDVIVIGCWTTDEFEPLAVGMFDPAGRLETIVMRLFLPDANLPCYLPLPTE